MHNDARPYYQMGAAEAARLIVNGELTATALVDACLERIRQTDRDIEAFVHLDRQAAMEQAAHADHLRTIGAPLGSLHGVPVAIKDVIDVAGWPCESGTEIFSGHRPAHDAQCVARLRQAGAIIIGKTVTAELASLTPGPTRNPVNRGHTPGGSSSGSAAAVAAFMAPLALGTQTAGSVLRPASYCGVYGFKPTLGLVSRRGVLMQSHTLDTVGLLARSLEDIALCTDVMNVHDPLDEVSFERSPSSMTDTLFADVERPLRLGFCRAPAWNAADVSMREAMESLVARLGSHCTVFELPPSIETIIQQQALIQFAENSFYYGEIYDKQGGKLSAGMRERIEGGLRTNARQYLEAISQRENHYAAFARIFESCDAIISPASCGSAPQGLEATGNPVFNGYWTWLGVPALAMPMFEYEGMPMGLQLTAARQCDGAVLNAARRLEVLLKNLD